jgi:alkylation response protein AidB-like acyl-CoA dehydrogenase
VIATVGPLVEAKGNAAGDTIFANSAVQAVLAEVYAQAIGARAIAAVHIERDANSICRRNINWGVALPKLAASDLRHGEDITVDRAGARRREVRCCNRCEITGTTSSASAEVKGDTIILPISPAGRATLCTHSDTASGASGDCDLCNDNIT